jgi:hypothetical protein
MARRFVTEWALCGVIRASNAVVDSGGGVELEIPARTEMPRDVDFGPE